MTEQAPNERSGLERRDVLKGLGFGAMSAVGSGAMAMGASAQEPDGMMVRPEADCAGNLLDYAMLVPAGERHDARFAKGSYVDSPDGAMDLLFQLDSPGMPKNGTRTIAYQIAFVRDNNQSATKPVESGRTRGFTGQIQTLPGGETRHREEFSTAGLNAGEEATRYWVVLTVADYSGLDGSLPMDAAVIPVDITNG